MPPAPSIPIRVAIAGAGFAGGIHAQAWAAITGADALAALASAEAGRELALPPP